MSARMPDYDVFEVNPRLDDYVWNLRNYFNEGKDMTAEKKKVIDGFLNVIFYEALSLKPCCIDDVTYLMYRWKNEGVNKKTNKFINSVIAEIKNLNDDVK